MNKGVENLKEFIRTALFLLKIQKQTQMCKMRSNTEKGDEEQFVFSLFLDRQSRGHSIKMKGRKFKNQSAFCTTVTLGNE